MTWHIARGNGHVLCCLRFQARQLGLTLSEARIDSLLPHPWTIRDFENANRRAKACKRRAKKCGYSGQHFTGHEWLKLYQAHNHRCLACGAWHSGDITADHVIPLGAGGSNRIDNIQPLCRSCHDLKERVWRNSGIAVDYREMGVAS